MKKDKIILILIFLVNVSILFSLNKNADSLLAVSLFYLVILFLNFDSINLFRKHFLFLNNRLKEEHETSLKFIKENGKLEKELIIALSQAKIYKDRNPLQSEIDELHKARKDLSKEAQKINELNR